MNIYETSLNTKKRFIFSYQLFKIGIWLKTQSDFNTFEYIVNYDRLLIEIV